MLPASATLDVRRLAALDMHGAHGSSLRRNVILGEFALGTIGGAALGAWALTWGGAVSVIVAIGLFGLAANYLALTAHVVDLWRPPGLDEELAGIDLRKELSYYTRVQFWVLVPFWIAGLALVQARRRPQR